MKKTILSIAAVIFFFTAFAGNGDPLLKEHPNKYCAKLKDGKVQIMHEGKVLTADVTLANGTKIMVDGTVIKSDGSKEKLKEGECLDKEGKIAAEESKDKTRKEKQK